MAMSLPARRNAQRRAARHELRTAKAFGVRRVHRARFESKPDVELVRLPDGSELSCECKTRKRLPALITKALEQAQRYAAPPAIPCAILSAFGERPVIVLPLEAFRKLAGLAPSAVPEQPSLFARAV
jgi:hypothetical protein